MNAETVRRERERARQHRIAAQVAASEGHRHKARHHRRAAERIARRLEKAGG